MRDYTRLIEVGKKNNGIIRTKWAVENGVPKDYLRFALEDDVIERVRHGFYVLKDTIVDEVFILQQRAKNLIYSFDTAAYYNGLTTRDPLRLTLTATRDTNTSFLHAKGFELNFHYVDNEKFELGKTKTKTIFGNQIVIYNMERTLCDLFSSIYNGDAYIALESLKNYVKRKDKNFYKLMKYAQDLGVEQELKKRLEVLI